MKLLSIETSCDETAVTLLEADGDEERARFRILGNALLSQIDIHTEYGGVFPALAKREHARNLVPVLVESLNAAGLLVKEAVGLPQALQTELRELLTREPELADALIAFLETHAAPHIDALCVTHGPGLEPALWVGVNFARALSKAWNVPIMPVNHMEGHLLSALLTEDGEDLVLEGIELPLLGLLISGGHTELVSMHSWLSYRLIGQTRDDAVGEAYDKVARMLGLPYPGGPEISKLAEASREEAREHPFKLPRPMLHDPHCDFSFSGLKTAVLYLLKGMSEVTDIDKQRVAEEFEDAVADVLYAKTARALEETGARTLALGGGVSANTNIRRVFAERLAADHPDVSLRIPAARFTTDNAIMIGIAGYFRALAEEFRDADSLRAAGNLSLS